MTFIYMREGEALNAPVYKMRKNCRTCSISVAEHFVHKNLARQPSSPQDCVAQRFDYPTIWNSENLLSCSFIHGMATIIITSLHRLFNHSSIIMLNENHIVEPKSS